MPLQKSSRVAFRDMPLQKSSGVAILFDSFWCLHTVAGTAAQFCTCIWTSSLCCSQKRQDHLVRSKVMCETERNTSACCTYGSRDGLVVRAFASHQCVPGSIPGPRVICGLSLLLGSLACSERFFSGYSAFPSLQKPAFSNSNSIWIIVKHFILSLWLGWSRKHSLCLTLNLHLRMFPRPDNPRLRFSFTVSRSPFPFRLPVLFLYSPCWILRRVTAVHLLTDFRSRFLVPRSLYPFPVPSFSNTHIKGAW